MEFYIGCPIWANKSWVGSLYPGGTKAADYLSIYARKLNTVEGNTTFYAVPSQTTIEHWVSETPPTFRFCPKIPRAISHAGRLTEHIAEAAGFVGVMSQLGPRLGPFFLQLPPSYPPDLLDDLRAFLEAWPAQAQLAVEVRHPGWFEAPAHEPLQALLAGAGMARVIIDTRPIRSLAQDPMLEGSVYTRLLKAREQKPDLPIILEPTAPFTFLRYIGHPDLTQNAPFLDEWAGHLARWLREERDVYVFCHCPDETMDPSLCHELHKRLSARGLVTNFPQLDGDSFVSQERLF